MSLSLHFDPHDPPEVIVDLDGDLGELHDQINQVRRLLSASPLDVVELEDATNWWPSVARIVVGVANVDRLAVEHTK